MSAQTSFEAQPRVAVVGLAGRFPGAPNPRVFWHNLISGIEAISPLTDQQLRRAGVPESWLRDPNYVKAAGLLEGVELFDAEFFGLTRSSAEVLNPQHRVFLECAWEALEDAGCEPQAFAGRIGVFAGSGSNGYFDLLQQRSAAAAALGAFQTGISNAKDFLATAVAYHLDLQGPALAVQTACSTSLVSVHLACQSLLNGECDLALAGGVSITVPQHVGGHFEEGGILSPDGHCRAFDADAQGTVGGSGAGVVALRRLEDAQQAGEAIRAVILGSAINNDGAAKAGFTAPGIRGQASVIAEALEVAGVAPGTLAFVEAHGTGTPLGDPMEVEALQRAFLGVAPGSCGLGSVKTSLGHLDTAAGVAGLIKTVLALEHGWLPPNLHFRRANPKIDFANSPFRIVREAENLPSSRRPWRAGVSSFGIGGTNAHLVLEEAPPVPLGLPPAALRPRLLVLSARTPEALTAASARLADHLETHPDLDLGAVAFSLLTGRRRFGHRRTWVAATPEEAVVALRSDGSGDRREDGPETSVAFLFPGQGSQYPAMGRRLYETQEVFRSHFDELAAAVRERYGLDLPTVLYGAPEASGPEGVEETDLLQPALFAVEYSLARLWMSWGIQPRVMLGHSLGEYVAAALAGVMEPRAAAVLVAGRGRLMKLLPAGAMLAVAASEEAVTPFFGDGISLAAVNGGRRCVVSGSVEAVTAVTAALNAQGFACRRLAADRAFHSEHLEAVLDELDTLLQEVSLRPPLIPYISNVSGQLIRPEEACDRGYWLRQARLPVRFARGLSTLAADSPTVLLEVGPGQALSTLARQHPDLRHCIKVGGLRPAGARDDSEREALRGLGELWTEGAEPTVSALFPVGLRRQVRLPTYPFQRQRYWYEDVPPDTQKLAAVEECKQEAGALPRGPRDPRPEGPPALLRILRAQEALMVQQRQALGLPSVLFAGGQGPKADAAGAAPEVEI